MDSLILDVISAEERLFLGSVDFAILPGIEGYFGVYPRHAPFISLLKPAGLLQFRECGDETVNVFYVFGGFCEVQPTQITVLADTVVRGPEIDEARMKAAQSLEQALSADHHQPIAYAKAMGELANFYVRDTHQNTYRHFKYKHRTFDH